MECDHKNVPHKGVKMLKKIFPVLLLGLLALGAIIKWTHCEQGAQHTTLVGRQYRHFIAPAVMPNGEIVDLDIKEYFKGHIGVIFFYPLDFTFVCPTEILAFHDLVQELERLDVKIVGISVNTVDSHVKWREATPEEGGVGHINYPLIADDDHKIMNMYGVPAPDQDVALRSTFIVDDATEKVIFQSVSDLSIGRNTDEVIRVIKAHLASRSGDKVCPANWQPGQEGMKPDLNAAIDFLKKRQMAKLQKQEVK